MWVWFMIILFFILFFIYHFLLKYCVLVSVDCLPYFLGMSDDAKKEDTTETTLNAADPEHEPSGSRVPVVDASNVKAVSLA